MKIVFHFLIYVSMVFVTVVNGASNTTVYNDGFELEKVENFVDSPYSDEELRDKLEQILEDKLPSESKYNKVKQLIQYGVYISNDNIYEAMGAKSGVPDYAVFRLLMVNAEVDPKELFGGALQTPNMYPGDDKFYIDDSLDMRDSNFNDAMKFAHFYTATGLFDKRIYKYLIKSRYNKQYDNPDVAHYLYTYIVPKLPYEDKMVLLIKKMYLIGPDLLQEAIKNSTQHKTFFMNYFLIKYTSHCCSDVPRFYKPKKFYKKYVALSKALASSYGISYTTNHSETMLGNSKDQLSYKAKCNSKNSWKDYDVIQLKTVYSVLKTFLDSGYKCDEDTVQIYNGLKKVLASNNAVERGCDILKSGYAYYRKDELRKVVNLLSQHINTKQAVSVKIAQLNKSLQTMIDKGDERGALFYMKKGATGNQKALIDAIWHKMDKIAKRMLTQSTFHFEPAKVIEKMYASGDTSLVKKLLGSRKFSTKQVADTVYVIANHSDRKNVALALKMYPQSSKLAMDLAYTHQQYNSMKIIASFGGSYEKNLLQKYEHKVALERKKAKKRERLRAEQERKKQEALQQAYNKKKYVGEQVCKDGTTALILSITMRGYVEAVNGSAIRIRISDTEGTTPYYHGVSLYKDTVIWDKYYNWRACQ